MAGIDPARHSPGKGYVMETQALVMGGATVGIWTANIGLLVRHWRRRLLAELPEVQRPYQVVVAGGVLLTLYITFMVILSLSQMGVLASSIARTLEQPKVQWSFILMSLGFGVLSVVLAWSLEFAPQMSRRVRMQVQKAAHDAEIEALNRVELALNEPLTEVLFAVREALSDPRLSTPTRESLEEAYQSGREVVAALDRVAVELEERNGNGNGNGH